MVKNIEQMKRVNETVKVRIPKSHVNPNKLVEIELTIFHFEDDENGRMYFGKTANGKRRYFRDNNIIE